MSTILRKSNQGSVFDVPLGTNTSNDQSPQVSGLEPYTGPWNLQTAAHLLRRTTFGATADQIRQAAETDLHTIVEELFSEKPMPALPVNYDFDEDPFVPIGESWINKPYSDNNQIIGYRRRSLAIWTMENLIMSGIHLREKMTLFWQNHFVTQATVLRDPNLIFYNNNLLRENALGNFRELTKKVTVNPAMLRYLNGNQNTNTAPNENYARELLELFTIGKGPLAGEGDYTTFTEVDVFEIARALTGWRDQGYFMRNGLSPTSRFLAFRHDRGIKTLSHRFQNATIENEGDEEYKKVVDIIFQQEEVSRFLCRKLYRWFVFYNIDEDIEKKVIEPLAEILRKNDYELMPVLRVLLTSQHFYEICSVGPMIKNPIDFAINLIIHFNIRFPENQRARNAIYLRLVQLFEAFQMNYYEPPNVAGWKAYYQEPLYYRTWITSATLPVRQDFTTLLAQGVESDQIRFGIDVLTYVSRFFNPFDPNQLIEEFAENLFPLPLTDEQKSYLKEILIPGLPDFEWSVEYGNYIEDPGNPEKRQLVESRLRTLVTALLSMPEYYLS